MCYTCRPPAPVRWLFELLCSPNHGTNMVLWLDEPCWAEQEHYSWVFLVAQGAKWLNFRFQPSFYAPARVKKGFYNGQNGCERERTLWNFGEASESHVFGQMLSGLSCSLAYRRYGSQEWVQGSVVAGLRPHSLVQGWWRWGDGQGDRGCFLTRTCTRPVPGACWTRPEHCSLTLVQWELADGKDLERLV